ncbi:MAG: leucine-rich repeat domain-containing protein [Oscillospiraceae bacterium]
MKYRAFGIIGALLCIFALCSCKNKNGEEQPAETTSAETGSASVTAAEKPVTEPQKITAEYDLTYEIENGEVKILGYKGFEKKVVIPDEILGCPVTKINARAFADTEVAELTLPETLTEFKGIKNAGKLKVLNLPSGLELDDLGGNMLGTDFITDVNIKEGGAFTSDNGIVYTDGGKTLVYYPQGRTGAFAVPEGVEAIESHAFRYSAITEITLPETLKSIGNGAFSDSGITTLDIPASVTEVGVRILGGNNSKCVTVDSGSVVPANLDYYNVIYRDDTTLKKAFRKATGYGGDKVFIDLNFDKFPEMIYGMPGIGRIVMYYDADEDGWQNCGFGYIGLRGIDLYYDRENDIYFYAACELSNSDREYPAYKYYVCRNGFVCQCIGWERLYFSREGENSNALYIGHVEGEFDFGFYEGEVPVGIDRLNKADSPFIELTHKALEKYEYIDTVDIKALFEQSVDGEDVFAGEFADEPNTSSLPKYAPEENITMFWSYAYGELAGEEVFERLSQNPNLTYYEIDDYHTVDLTGIEKLKSVKEFTIRYYAVNPEKIAELENVEILHISGDFSDLSFISEMKKLSVIEFFGVTDRPDDYFEPIYGCENIECMIFGENRVNDAQLEAIKENMPWIKIILL